MIYNASHCSLLINFIILEVKYLGNGLTKCTKLGFFFGGGGGGGVKRPSIYIKLANTH